MRRTGLASAAALLMVVVGCGTGLPEAPKPDSPDPVPTSSPSPTPIVRHAGTLSLAAGETISYWCAGQGSAGVLLEAGTDSGGTDAYPAAFVDPLAALTTVCTYDRPGTGSSDAAPHRRRTMQDLCAVQDEVVANLPIRPPVILVGQSGGGNLDIGCASRHPERVAGLVTIDSYHDDPDGLRSEGLVWTDNPEFVDYIDYSEELDTLTMPLGGFPVLVISATQADTGGQENQSYWLKLSPNSRQVTIEGPHNLQVTAPEQVVTEIINEFNRT